MRYIGDFNPYGVKALWELRLREEIVARIFYAAMIYGKSMSWVVRYCVFSLVRDKSLTKEKILALCESLREKNQEKPRKSQELRRFRICLYGEDESLFVELKMRYRVPTSLLIRVAIHLYLEKLILGQVSDWEFFWYGLKFFREILTVTSGKKEIPQADLYIGRFLAPWEYWGIPDGPYPPYLMGKNLSLQ